MLCGSLIQAMNKFPNHLELIGLDRHEEVAECEVADHHVLEDSRLRWLQALDEGRCSLEQFVDVLISRLLLPQRQLVFHFRNDQMVQLD